MERNQSESQDEAENVILAELNFATECPPGTGSDASPGSVYWIGHNGVREVVVTGCATYAMYCAECEAIVLGSHYGAC